MELNEVENNLRLEKIEDELKKANTNKTLGLVFTVFGAISFMVPLLIVGIVMLVLANKKIKTLEEEKDNLKKTIYTATVNTKNIEGKTNNGYSAGTTNIVEEHDKVICCDCGVEYSLDDVKNMLSQEKEPQVDTQTVNEPKTLTTKEVVTENVVSSFGIKKEREDTLIDGDKKEREEEKSNFSQREKVNRVHVHNFDNENLEEDENNEDEDVVSNQYSSNNNVSLQGSLNVALDEPKQATEILKKDKQQKKVSAGTLTIIILFAIFAAVSGILILLSILDDSGAYNILLLIVGLVELAMCFVSYKIVQHRERYTCPECGTKRIHHRRYLNTTSVTKTYSSNQSGLDTTTYTHHYHDTYVCPHCGETKHENVSKHGGTLRVHNTGYVDDSRIAPREF